MNNHLIYIGTAVILIGFFLVFIASLTGTKDSKIAIGGFIGFIPFGFANDSKMLWIVGAISFVMFVVFMFFQFYNK